MERRRINGRSGFGQYDSFGVNLLLSDVMRMMTEVLGLVRDILAVERRNGHIGQEACTRGIPKHEHQTHAKQTMEPPGEGAPSWRTNSWIGGAITELEQLLQRTLPGVRSQHGQCDNGEHTSDNSSMSGGFSEGVMAQQKLQGEKEVPACDYPGGRSMEYASQKFVPWGEFVNPILLLIVLLPVV